MKKSLMMLMSISIAFSSWACSAKTEVNLPDVTFKSFYLGTNKNPPENEQILLTVLESQLVESFLDKEDWISVIPNNAELKPIGVLLTDTDGLRYELYQALDQIVIKVTYDKKSPVYFQVEGDQDRLIYGQLRSLKQAIDNKAILLNSPLISANSDLTAATDDMNFDLTTNQSDQLHILLKIKDWNVVPNDLNNSMLDADLSIKVSNGNTLMFRSLESNASVFYLQTINGKTEISTYEITKPIYDAIKAQLNTWQLEAYPNKPDLTQVVFTQVKFQLDGVPTHLLKSVFFSITETESNQAKPALRISDWVRVKYKLVGQISFMTLIDTEGYVYSIDYTETGLAVHITRSDDPTFDLSYLIPSNTIQIGAAFMPLWKEAVATKSMLAFLPTQLKIGSTSGEEVTYRNIDLSSSEAQSLISLLKLSTWAVDPEPDKYAFGWVPIYILRDNKGNSFSIYNYFTHDIMAVVVRNTSTSSDEWIWYFTSNTIYIDFETYIKAHYPNP